MKNRIQFFTFVATLAVVFGLISWGSALAQTSPSTDQTTPQTQPTPTPDTPPSQQTPQTQPTPSPDNPPATQQTPSSSQMPSSDTPSSSQAPSSQTPSQTPDNTPAAGTPSTGTSNTGSAADATSTGTEQSFSGTVEKQGDKYVLKDDSGKVYDIDHQTDVAKFDGKRVRVKGTLDSTGSKILVK